MPFFQWDPKYDLRIAAMNDEHRELIQKMETLHARTQAGGDKAELQRLLQDLAAFTIKHFADEEAYMASVRFPELEVHKKIHHNLLTRVTEFQKQLDAKGPAALNQDFFGFLKMWLGGHIQDVDMKYSRHTHGATARPTVGAGPRKA